MSRFCPECGDAFGDDFRSCPHDGVELREVDAEGAMRGRLLEGRYRLVEEIGRGEVGVVYRAVQRSVGRHVAVKLLRDGLNPTARDLERFRREARTVSRLSHPNIVQPVAHGFADDQSVVYLAMDLLPGTDLRGALRSGPIPANVALDIAFQIAGALAETHAEGLVHRDLKPSNLMLAPVSDGRVLLKILDFGFARAVDEPHRLTAEGVVGGPPLFMSPEQAMDEELDARSDLYSLGVVLYESMTGRPPFEGSIAEVMKQHVHASPPELGERMPPGRNISRRVEQLVEDLLRKDPAERPESARDVRGRIAEIRRESSLADVPSAPKQSAEEIVKRYLQRPRLDEQLLDDFLPFRSKDLERMSPVDVPEGST